jgi:hypothetical protein
MEYKWRPSEDVLWGERGSMGGRRYSSQEVAEIDKGWKDFGNGGGGIGDV